MSNNTFQQIQMQLQQQQQQVKPNSNSAMKIQNITEVEKPLQKIIQKQQQIKILRFHLYNSKYKSSFLARTKLLESSIQRSQIQIRH